MGNPLLMKVLLGDEQALVRAGLRCLLHSAVDPALEVVGESDDGQALLTMVETLSPACVVIEHGLTSMSGTEVALAIGARHPEVKVMFLSAWHEPAQVHGAIRAGASAYVLKGAAPEQLFAAFKTLADGGSYFSPEIAALAQDRRTRARDAREGVLTSRQRQVLRLMARGKSTKEIAAFMGVSIKTVETHRARLAGVLGLYGVNALMHFALKAGMDSGEI